MPVTESGGVAIHFDICGAGETLVLSAGLGGTSGYWDPQVEALSRRFRVVRYDHAGSGRSGRDVGPRSVAEFAADLEAVILASGAERAHVLGHAVGGMTGLQLAMDRPGRVASLVIANGWGAPDPHVTRCFSVRRNLLNACGVAAYVEAQPLFLYPAAWAQAHEASLRAAARHQPVHMPSPADLLSRIAAFEAFAPADAALAGVDVPVLCLSTRDDMLVPWTASEALARRLPRAGFLCLPSGGHASSQTEPEAFMAALSGFHDQVPRQLPA